MRRGIPCISLSQFQKEISNGKALSTEQVFSITQQSRLEMHISSYN